MHPEAYAACERFFERYLLHRGPMKGERTVLDVGSYDVNGTVRPIFEYHSKPDVEWWTYTGLDQTEGPNVDRVIADGGGWGWVDYFDCVVTVSALEHDPRWWVTLEKMFAALKVGGQMFVCAPSRGDWHGYPKDYYRFFTDVWQSFHGHRVMEGQTIHVLDTWYSGGYYNDAIGVFTKTESDEPVD